MNTTSPMNPGICSEWYWAGGTDAKQNQVSRHHYFIHRPTPELAGNCWTFTFFGNRELWVISAQITKDNVYVWLVWLMNKVVGIWQSCCVEKKSRNFGWFCRNCYNHILVKSTTEWRSKCCHVGLKLTKYRKLSRSGWGSQQLLQNFE